MTVCLSDPRSRNSRTNNDLRTSLFRLTGEFRVSLNFFLRRMILYSLLLRRLTLAGFLALLKTPKSQAIILLNINGVIVTLTSITSTRTVFNVREYVSSTVNNISSPQMLSNNYRSLRFETGTQDVSTVAETNPRADIEWQEMGHLTHETKIEGAASALRAE